MVAQRYESYFQVIGTIFLERAQRVSTMLFLSRENKFLFSNHRVIFFLFAQTKEKE